MDKIQYIHTDKWRKFKTDTQINGQNTKQTHWQMEKSQYIHTNKWTKYKTDTQINGQIARQTHRQMDKILVRQIDSELIEKRRLVSS